MHRSFPSVVIGILYDVSLVNYLLALPRRCAQSVTIFAASVPPAAPA
jgi:hypothetical protein